MSINEYALLKDSEVINIILFDDSSDEDLNNFILESGADSSVILTEETGKPLVGYVYDNEVFFGPSPFPSWVKDYTLKTWVSSVALPEDSFRQVYDWNEETLSWVAPEIPDEEPTP